MILCCCCLSPLSFSAFWQPATIATMVFLSPGSRSTVVNNRVSQQISYLCIRQAILCRDVSRKPLRRFVGDGGDEAHIGSIRCHSRVVSHQGRLVLEMRAQQERRAGCGNRSGQDGGKTAYSWVRCRRGYRRNAVLHRWLGGEPGGQRCL